MTTQSRTIKFNIVLKFEVEILILSTVIFEKTLKKWVKNAGNPHISPYTAQTFNDMKSPYR